MFRRVMAYALSTMLGLGFLSGCGSVADEASWTATDGTVITWEPSSPRFGDLVRVRAVVPRQLGDGEALTRDGQTRLIPPKGGYVPPSSAKEEAEGRVIRWDFRAEVTGDWTWGEGGHTLWQVKSEAGTTTELKREDAQMLWSGKK